ncbi:MAG: UvrD-helicase domain-containing protein [Candidatus Sericytochromatia bacterium]|nr:UvrD-helicase domain-containing protein [Candidatus Sericytochromatia bacterium]
MLNPSQKQAVEHLHGPALVLAGAGAGKTRVLTQRVAYLLDRNLVDPSRILVVTFTNKAAREMRERLAKLLGWEQVKQIWAGTFHAICCRILRQEIESLNLGYTGQFAIYDPKDQEKMMDLTIRSLNLDPKDYQASKLLQIVSRLKNSDLPPEAVSASDFEDAFQLKVYRQYQETLRLNNAMDFDDILFLTLRLLREQPDARHRLQQRFAQILVDEYQDTNTVQFELIRLLGDAHRNIFVVGDVDQSIYSFRHANFRIILRFQEDYPDARLIKLEENYRSTGRILAAANALIQRNSERFDKNLIATRGQGQPLRFVQTLNEDEESAWIVKQIKKLQEQEQIPFGSFAILYRTNAQSRIYEQRLIQYGVPYHVVGGFRFYDRREIKDLLSYLYVLQNPLDSLSLKRILNVPKRGLGAKAVEMLETSASFEGRGLTLWDAIQTERVTAQLPSSKAQEALQTLAWQLRQWRQEPMPVSELIERVYHESGYRAELEQEPDSKKRVDRQENVTALIQAALEYEAEAEDKTSLTGFLEKIALFSDTDNLKEQNQAVNLMTVHGAKGLEFPMVFIPAVEEGIFPHVRSILEESNGAIEEERRLMYVAVTRAQDRLFMTFAGQRRNRRGVVNSRLSRFVLEMGEHLELPGELLADVQRYNYEQRLKKMNLKGVKDLPDLTDLPGESRSEPETVPLHPATRRIAQMVQQKQAGTQSALPASAQRPAMPAGRVPQPDMPRSAPAAKAAAALVVGDRVRHPSLGDGQIEKIIPPLAKIRFASGVKTLHLQSAPIEKIS